MASSGDDAGWSECGANASLSGQSDSGPTESESRRVGELAASVSGDDEGWGAMADRVNVATHVAEASVDADMDVDLLAAPRAAVGVAEGDATELNCA